MSSQTGSCHCGAARFSDDLSATHLIRCNCSLSSGTGALNTRVPETSSVEIVAGEAELSSYQLPTRTAEYLFCAICGVHLFYRSRVDLSHWGVNARCLDDGLP